MLLTSKSSNIIDFKRNGLIGDENPVTFKILQNLSIEKFHDINDSNKSFEVLKIDEKGKWNKIQSCINSIKYEDEF